VTDRSLERIGAACGIVYVVLAYIGSGLGVPGSAVGTTLVLVGFLALLIFLSSVWSAMRRAEGGSGWLSATAFGAGLMSITIGLESAAPLLVARYRAGGLDPQLARSLHDVEEASYFLGFLPLAVLLAAFAIVAIRPGPLPGWLGWVGAALSAAFLAGGLLGTFDLASEWAQAPMLVYPIWVIATSVVLIRHAGEPDPVATEEAPTGHAAPVGR
jgi:hypothetical protein